MLQLKLSLATGLLLAASLAHATVRLPALVGSHMVLQRGRPVPVWGWAAPGEKVSITFRVKLTWLALPMLAGAGKPHYLLRRPVGRLASL
jgi:hypothetical protein